MLRRRASDAGRTNNSLDSSADSAFFNVSFAFDVVNSRPVRYESLSHGVNSTVMPSRLARVTSGLFAVSFRNMDYDATDIAVTYDRGRDHGPEFLDLWMNVFLVTRERSAHENDPGSGLRHGTLFRSSAGAFRGGSYRH